MKTECRTFRATSWEDAISQAQEFLGTLSAPGQVLSISHVSELTDAVVFVWYAA